MVKIQNLFYVQYIFLKIYVIIVRVCGDLSVVVKRTASVTPIHIWSWRSEVQALAKAKINNVPYKKMQFIKYIK